MLTWSAAVLNLLPSQFISLLAGVIGDINFLLGHDIPSDLNHLSPSHSFIYYVSSPTGIIPPWCTLLNLKWCGWIGGRSEIGDGH